MKKYQYNNMLFVLLVSIIKWYEKTIDGSINNNGNLKISVCKY